jgi:hypothetical protein
LLEEGQCTSNSYFTSLQYTNNHLSKQIFFISTFIPPHLDQLVWQVSGMRIVNLQEGGFSFPFVEIQTKRNRNKLLKLTQPAIVRDPFPSLSACEKAIRIKKEI